jgi:hypothetical protein
MNSELLNKIAADLTPISPDKITAAELRGVLELAANQMSSDVAYGTAIPFNRLVSNLGTHSLVANQTYTVNTTNAVPGFGAILRIVANGVNTIDITAFKKKDAAEAFDITNGVTNVLMFMFDGVDYLVSISQPENASGAPDIVAPVLQSATIETANPDRVILTYNENLNAGSVPAIGAYVPTVNGVDRATTSVSLPGGAVVHVNFNGAAVEAGDTIVIDYTAGANPIEDAAGNNAGNLVNQAVTNNVSAGYDADAQAFITYVEALPATMTVAEKDAVSDYVVARKAAGLWAKDIAIYPRVGSTIAAMGVNLKNPGTYSHAYTGAPTVNAAGLSWAGGTDRGTLTGLDKDAIGSNHFGFDVWLQTNVQNVYFGTVSGVAIAAFLTDNASLFSYPSIGANSTGIAIPNLNNAGLLNTLQRLDVNGQEYYRGAALIGNDGVVLNSFGDTTQDLTIHGYNGNNNADSVVESYSGVHLAFSGAEQASNNTIVSAFITALGR